MLKLDRSLPITVRVEETFVQPQSIQRPALAEERDSRKREGLFSPVTFPPP